MKHFLADGPGPDIMLLDFFQWGCVKDYVYMSSVDDIGTLCAKIIEAIQSAAEGMLTSTWTEQDYQVDVIRATSSSHVEVGYSMHKLLSYGTICKRLHISICFGYCVINL